MVLGRGPFADVVAEHRLGVRRSEHDRVVIGGGVVSRDLVEGGGAFVHGGPERVGAEAEHEFEDAGVGLGGDGADLRLEGFRGPWLEAPVFVVDENAAVFHRRGFLDVGAGFEKERIALRRWDIRPPDPRGNADGF